MYPTSIYFGLVVPIGTLGPMYLLFWVRGPLGLQSSEGGFRVDTHTRTGRQGLRRRVISMDRRCIRVLQGLFGGS